jgi:hypothetical protein
MLSTLLMCNILCSGKQQNANLGGVQTWHRHKLLYFIFFPLQCRFMLCMNVNVYILLPFVFYIVDFTNDSSKNTENNMYRRLVKKCILHYTSIMYK